MPRRQTLDRPGASAGVPDGCGPPRLPCWRRFGPQMVTIAVGLVLVPLVHRRTSPDGIVYLSLAEHWSAGRVTDAVNGFWSPLLSWMLAPAAALGVPMLIAARLLQLGVALFAVTMLQRLMRALRLEPVLSEVLVLATVPFLLYAAFSLVAPDLLMAASLLGYLVTIVDPRPRSPLRRGVVAGLWAGAAFLSKTYALPFVLAHLAAVVAVRLLSRAPVRDQLRTAGAAFAVIATVVVAWAIPLSVKYGEPTVSTAARYHVQITAANSRGNAFSWAGLLAPPNDHAVSAWEDPASMPRDFSAPASAADGSTATASASETSSSATDARLARIVDNLRDMVRSGALMGAMSVLAAVSALVIVRSWLVRRADGVEPEVDVVTAASVYVGGLSLLVTETRYLWFPLLLTVPLGAWGLQQLRRRLAGRASTVLVGMVVVVSVAAPLVALGRAVEKSSNEQDNLDELATVLADGDRVASSSSALALLTPTCYELGCTYWGVPSSSSGPALAAELASRGIHRLVVSDGDDVDPGPSARRLLTSSRLGLAVYDVAGRT